MCVIKTSDGTELFFRDWGPKTAPAIVFHHGWPLSADEWDSQMLYFHAKGFRVIAHDRRGHGRSSQPGTGNDMATYAADVADLVTALGLHNAIHVGHSVGGGEVARYVANAKRGLVSKAVLIGSVTPTLLQSERNPAGLPIEVFDGFRAAMRSNRAQFFQNLPTGPFYGYNRDGAQVSQGVIQNWWRQAMMGSALAQYECIRAFSETDQTEDLKRIDLPVLVMHGTGDQIVPYATTAPLTADLLEFGKLKSYIGLPHGMCTTSADYINADLLTFFQS